MIKVYLSNLMGAKKSTIQDIADATGLSRTTISNLYHEKVTAISFETMMKLCKFFDCKLSDLIEYIPDEKPENPTAD